MDRKTYMLELDEGELSLVGRALAELPYRVAAPLIAKIGQQVQAEAQGDAHAPQGGGDIPPAEPWKK